MDDDDNEQLNIDIKDIRTIKNMYWKQTATMRMNNDYTGFQQIKREVRHGCVLFPDLFSLNSEHIMRNIINFPGLKITGHNII